MLVYVTTVALLVYVKKCILTVPKQLKGKGLCEHLVIQFVNAGNFCKNLGLAVSKIC